MSNKKRKTLAILLASVLLDFVGAGLVIPLLPFYAQTFGGSAAEIGVLMGLFPLMGIIAPAIWGSLSDRMGRRPALLFNIAGTSLSFLWLGLANSLWMLFMARLLAGVSSASIVIAQSYASDLTTPEQRTKVLSFLEGAAGIGFVIGPFISGLLIGSNPTEADFRLPGLVATIPSTITFALAWFALPNLKHRTPLSKGYPSIHQYLGTIKTTFQRPLIKAIMIVVFVTMFVTMGVQATFALWSAQKFGWGPQQFGYFLIFYCAAIAMIQFVITGRLARRLGEVKLLFVSLITGTLGLILVPLSTTVPQLIGAMIPLIFSVSTGNPTLTSLLSHLSGAKQQGKTLGLMQSVIGLGGCLGAIGAGIIFMLGPDWHYQINTILMIGATLFCWIKITQTRLLAVKRDRRHQKLLHFFDMLDHDNNGVLELQDFKQAGQTLAQLMGWQPGTTQYGVLQASFIGFGELLQELADQDGNTKIDQAEWLHCLEDRIDYDFSNFFLQIIDVNQDGQVAFEELKLFYQVYDIAIDDLEHIFHILDLNQDGYISQEEFETLFTQFLYSDDIQSPGNWILGASLPIRL